MQLYYPASSDVEEEASSDVEEQASSVGQTGIEPIIPHNVRRGILLYIFFSGFGGERFLFPVFYHITHKSAINLFPNTLFPLLLQ